ncbi:MAG: polymer-forming cytoskeletal protein [Lachnospiraceae bacterium]|nr:polymer-forming cytoskeletal protein [Lachnospiraceae bacterium]MCR5778846.1 polymer-forming cytoskeletal protein [Lachnospiraceae bacterium]
MGFFSDFKDDDLESSLSDLEISEASTATEPAVLDGEVTEELTIGDEVFGEGPVEEVSEEITIPEAEGTSLDSDLSEDIPDDVLLETVTAEPVEVPESDSKEKTKKDKLEESSMSADEKDFKDGMLGDGPVSDEVGSITAGMTINGNIASEGSLDIFGTVIGDIKIKGKLNISGNITGNSNAAEIFADSAKITGEVVSQGAVKVGQESVILGNISATSAVIAGAVKGNIDVHGPVILDTSAIVMGDIKSKSVQINNGAVIEGHCSQCYAEVSPTSFFEDFKSNIEGKKKK